MTPQELVNKYEKALASQEWSNIEPLMHDDICVTFSTGTYKGKDQVRKAFEQNFATIKEEEYSINDLTWVLVGNECAVCSYSFQWQGLVNGQPSSGGGRGTSVLVNMSGKWQIITEHLGPHAL